VDRDYVMQVAQATTGQALQRYHAAQQAIQERVAVQPTQPTASTAEESDSDTEEEAPAPTVRSEPAEPKAVRVEAPAAASAEAPETKKTKGDNKTSADQEEQEEKVLAKKPAVRMREVARGVQVAPPQASPRVESKQKVRNEDSGSDSESESGEE
jgi:hypothetical protein